MSRDFDGIDDVILIGEPAVLADLSVYTYTAWIYPRTVGEGGLGRIMDRSNRNWHVQATNTFRVDIGRATTNAEAAAVNNVLTMNDWNFVVMQWTDAAGYPKLYHALGTAAPVEVSYATQVRGSGAMTADAGNPLRIGNRSAADRTFDGRLAGARIYRRLLTVDEMRQVQRGALHPDPDLVGWWALEGTTAPEPDWSGNGNTGAVTGAVQAAQPPAIQGYKIELTKDGVPLYSYASAQDGFTPADFHTGYEGVIAEAQARLVALADIGDARTE